MVKITVVYYVYEELRNVTVHFEGCDMATAEARKWEYEIKHPHHEPQEVYYN